MRRTLLVLAALGATACSVQRVVVRTLDPTFRHLDAGFKAEQSPEQARMAGPALLNLLEGFLKTDPGNPTLQFMSMELYTSYAFAFAEEEDALWARSLYRKGLQYGSRFLDQRISFTAALNGGSLEAFESQLQRLTYLDVPYLYWTGQAYAGLINTSREDLSMVERLGYPKAMMKRVIQLNRFYFHGGAYLVLGQIAGTFGKDMGGDPKLAGEMFDEAIAIAKGRLILAPVMKARYHLTHLQDRDGFLKTLQAVVDTKLADDPGTNLINALAQARAKKLIDDVDEYFVPPKLDEGALQDELGGLEDLDDLDDEEEAGK